MKPSAREPRVAVALSGGRDSAALLAATLRAASALGVEVVALHVHHGLSPRADDWVEHCRVLCRELGSNGAPVRLLERRLRSRPPAGESVEAWARRERYRALADMAHAARADLVLLAHHRRDQAETFVLQALRGAGPAGLAAMPARALRDGLTWARPWLDQPRERIEAYAAARGIAFVDDDSNGNPRFARNRLRLAVWPLLVEAFADAETALAQAARQAQAALQCLDEVALEDLAAVGDARGLHVAAWSALTPGRRANALRAWLKRATGHAAAQTLVDRLLGELPALRAARWPAAGGQLRCYRGVLEFAAGEGVPPTRDPAGATAVRITRAGRYRQPAWDGVLVVRRVAAEGVALARLGQAWLRPRHGGETFQRAPASTARSLKKQFQAVRRPAWERDGPLLFDAGGELLYVPGLGIDARAWAAPGEPQVSLEWEAAATGG